MNLISNDFRHNIKMYNFHPYNVLLAIATNIPVLLISASVLQGHICDVYSILIEYISQLCITAAHSET